MELSLESEFSLLRSTGLEMIGRRQLLPSRNCFYRNCHGYICSPDKTKGVRCTSSPVKLWSHFHDLIIYRLAHLCGLGVFSFVVSCFILKISALCVMFCPTLPVIVLPPHLCDCPDYFHLCLISLPSLLYLSLLFPLCQFLFLWLLLIILCPLPVWILFGCLDRFWPSAASTSCKPLCPFWLVNHWTASSSAFSVSICPAYTQNSSEL